MAFGDPINWHSPADDWMNRGQTAKFLKISGLTLDRWVAKGQLPKPVRFSGKALYWSRKGLLAFIEQKFAGASAKE